MQPETLNTCIALFILFASSVWLPIVVRWSNEGEILPYEPRRPVPWGVFGAIPALFLALTTLANALSSEGTSPELELDPGDALQTMIGVSASIIVMTAACAIIVITLSGATMRDIGLPCSKVQVRRDVLIGAVCWMACLLPVFGVQLLLILIFEQSSQNPVIKIVEANPGWPIFAAAFLSAVIVAPICEEFLFRALLQGWLERVEDRLIPPYPCKSVEVASDAIEGVQKDESGIEQSFINAENMDTGPPQRSLFGIRRGVIPILISSLFFSLAHFGNGPDPVAIFVLALFLGYLYQRTHRIVPCIVLHALFNGLSLVLLWLSLFAEQ